MIQVIFFEPSKKNLVECATLTKKVVNCEAVHELWLVS